MLVGGLVLLQLSFVVDFSDGEIARYRAQEEGTPTNAGGAYLDWIGHYYVPAIAIGALAWGAYTQSGHDWLLLAALVAILSVVRVAYSARDHVLLGLYRDRPELRGSPEFLRAVLARQGGDPERLDLEGDYRARRAGAAGTTLLWRRWTGLGQLLVFPGFVNLLTLLRRDRPRAGRPRRRIPDDRARRRPGGADRATRDRAPRPSAPRGCAGLRGPAAPPLTRTAPRARGRGSRAAAASSAAWKKPVPYSSAQNTGTSAARETKPTAPESGSSSSPAANSAAANATIRAIRAHSRPSGNTRRVTAYMSADHHEVRRDQRDAGAHDAVGRDQHQVQPDVDRQRDAR